MISTLWSTARVLLCESRPVGAQCSTGRWLSARMLPHSGDRQPETWRPRDLMSSPTWAMALRPLLLERVAKNRRCLPPAHRAPAAKTTTSKALLWPVALSDHCSVILFHYSYLELKFWLLLWICYDHYNLSSIILCICFETWHTQPQIPGSATALIIPFSWCRTFELRVSHLFISCMQSREQLWFFIFD